MNSQSPKVVVVADQKRIAVKDISRSGLMVEYNPVANKSIKTDLIDIVAYLHQQVYLPGVYCRTIYDILGLAENRSFRGEKIRCRGLEFVELTKSQEESLTIIIDGFHHTSPGD